MNEKTIRMIADTLPEVGEPTLETLLDKKFVDSSTDARTVNNSMVRHSYRVLSDEEKAGMVKIKDAGQAFIDLVTTTLGQTREASLAITNAQQAVMWAVNGLTK